MTSLNKRTKSTAMVSRSVRATSGTQDLMERQYPLFIIFIYFILDISYLIFFVILATFVTFVMNHFIFIIVYTQCSKTCNTGYKSRIIKCISLETGLIAPAYYCDSHLQPVSRIACSRHPCPAWNTGDWSEVNFQIIMSYQ